MGSLVRAVAPRARRRWLLIGGLVLGLVLSAPDALAQRWVFTGSSAVPASTRLPAPRRTRHQAAGSGLRVIPFPGTPDAAPVTDVIFSALRPQELRAVIVTGSRSGRHSGHLELLPAGAGTAFIPSRRFVPGELVHVSVWLSSRQAGIAAGDHGGTRLSYSFQVGEYSRVSIQHSLSNAAGIGPNQHFHSAPDLRPPVVSVTSDPDRSSGDIFLVIQGSFQEGPMIIDGHGHLVWFDPVARAPTSFFASDLAVQHYEGRPVLTWWQGEQLGAGEDLLMNRSYRTVAVVHAGNGYQADFHEFQITHKGTALLDAVSLTHTNLTSVGGSADGPVLDDIIQEVDIKTGQVLWEWHSLGHVPVNASYERYSSSAPFYDYFHLNSIQQLPGGNLLISARHTWSVYEISRRTGKVLWTLGGKHSDFKIGPGANFEWQHDARLYGHTLSLFDDAAAPAEERQSSAKYLKLDVRDRTVSLVRSFTHTPPLLSGAAGSAQPLRNGDIFVGWGALPEFSEFTPSGRQIFNGAFAFGLTSYRAFRFPWVGSPRTRPSVTVSPGVGGRATAYVSWNGATQVMSWRVLGGSTRHDLKPLGITEPRKDFETAISVPSQPGYYAVQALARSGQVLGTSVALSDPAHLAIYGSKLFAPSRAGDASVAVGCLSRHACRVRVTVSARGSVLGHSGVQKVAPYRGEAVSVRLPISARSERVRVRVRSLSGLSAGKPMKLISYSAHGPRLRSAPIRAGEAQVLGSRAFVGSAARAGILTACYSSAPCRIAEILTVGSDVIAREKGLVGANELAYVEAQLNQKGRSLLARARGNQLPVHLEITGGGGKGSGQVDLISYG